MSIRAIVERCEDLYHDLDLGYVRDWKARHGAKAIGFMPVYVPRELIHAAGMLPVGIMGGADEVEIIRGDAYYQSYICHIPRSTIELGLAGKLACLDGMLFPAICDVIRNLSGMWQIMFPDRYVRYVDFPQSWVPAAYDFYRAELREMLHDLERLSGIEATTERLNRSIALYNDNRRALTELYDLRAEQPHRVPTSELYLLLRAGNVLEVSEHTALLQDYLGAARGTERPLRDNIRVVASGLFCEQPPLSMVRAMENSGCYIVDDDWVLGARYQHSETPQSHDPIRAIADSYMQDTVQTATRYVDDGHNGDYLVQQVRSRGAEGVIFAAASFCDPALLDRPMGARALTDAGIPYTAFTYSENTGQIQVIKEQAGTFADSIKLWGSV
ncbi:MAG: benzoyl-CoA reductase subunit C [Gammaproteobacteria bacterium]|nr:benzoyl-CoA reductase subunit C [Gammaproteobacteria bacterium]